MEKSYLSTVAVVTGSHGKIETYSDIFELNLSVSIETVNYQINERIKWFLGGIALSPLIGVKLVSVSHTILKR